MSFGKTCRFSKGGGPDGGTPPRAVPAGGCADARGGPKPERAPARIRARAANERRNRTADTHTLRKWGATGARRAIVGAVGRDGKRLSPARGPALHGANAIAARASRGEHRERARGSRGSGGGGGGGGGGGRQAGTPHDDTSSGLVPVHQIAAEWPRTLPAGGEGWPAPRAADAETGKREGGALGQSETCPSTSHDRYVPTSPHDRSARWSRAVNERVRINVVRCSVIPRATGCGAGPAAPRVRAPCRPQQYPATSLRTSPAPPMPRLDHLMGCQAEIRAAAANGAANVRVIGSGARRAEREGVRALPLPSRARRAGHAPATANATRNA